MKIGELFVEFKHLNIDINSIVIDSKKKALNSLFVCIKGSKNDSHNNVLEAISNGAIFIVSETELDISIPYIIVSSTRRELARITSIFYGNPSSYLNVIGVTGTDGKTTISTLLSQVLNNCGYIGTSGITYNNNHFDTLNTTPSSLIINQFLADMKKEKIENVAMEVSSKSILDSRIDYIPFQIAIFTNLTHEHLNDHHTMEEYFITKAKLFLNLDKTSLAIINIDDEYGKRLKEMLKCHVITYGINNKADIMAKNIRYNQKEMFFDMVYKYRIYKNIHVNLIGEYNVLNILAVIAVLFDYNIPFSDIRKRLYSVSKIDGRMIFLKTKDKEVIVDFAHTPNALFQFLSTVRKICKGNLISILGCAGNKDKSKRPLMGLVATTLADFVIFTEEDSYDESLEIIIDDLTRDIKTNNYIVIPNRKEAIAHSIKMANHQDIITISGKGNEKTMTKEGTVLKYNDISEFTNILIS